MSTLSEHPRASGAVAPPEPLPRASGARSSALVFGASLVATIANYCFLLIAGRVLGSDDYGALAALLGFLTIVLLPTGALQLAISREVSRRLAEGDSIGATAFARAVFRLGLLVTVPIVAAGLALSGPLASLLQIESTSIVALSASGLSVAFALPIALGVLQGYQRFHAVAFLYVFPFVLRLALLVVVAWLGYRLGGAVYAAVGGGIVAAVVGVTLIEHPLREGGRVARPSLRPFLRYLAPVVLGVIGIAILTNVDLLAAKARLVPAEAGEYAAASAFARVAFFLPATILAVLFPRTAARQARGEESGDILGRSLLVTAAFCALLTLVYGLSGRGLVHTSFGAAFADGAEVLVPLTAAVTCYSLANILVGFHLSRGETRYAWILAAAVPVQVGILAFVPGGMDGIVWANLGVGAGLLVAHELLVSSSLPALRLGAARLLGARSLPRRALRETALAVAAFAVAAAVLTWPLATDFGSAFAGSVGADASGTIWWFWHWQEEGAYHLFGTTHHVLTGAPFGYQESNALNLQWLLPYYPAYLATALVGEVVAYNLVVVSGFVLSAAAMYALVRYLGCAPLVAGWAGLAYMIFPAHVTRIEHASLLHFEVLVLALFAAVVAAARSSRLRSRARMALVAAAVLAAWFTSGYFGVMATIGVVAFALGAALVSPGRRTRLGVGIAGVAVLTTAVLGAIAFAGGAGSVEIRERELTDLSIFGLRADELVVPARNLLLGHRLEGYHATRGHGSNPSETANYLGLLTIGLAVAGLVLAWRRRRSLDAGLRACVVGLTAVVLASLVFAAPNPIHVLGVTIDWMPSRILWSVVGEFRVLSRWTAMAMTALIPLAALGLQAAWVAVSRRVEEGAAHRLAPTALAAGAIAISVLELGWPLGEKVTPTEPAPAYYAGVAKAPDGLLVEYPLKRSDIYNFWQRVHGRRLVNGAPAGTFANEVERTLVDPDATGVAERLALLGVTAIVTRTGVMHFASDEPVEFRATDWGDGYALLGRYADGTSVWRVTARPAPAVTALPSDSFLEGVVHDDLSVGHPLTGQTGHLELHSEHGQAVELGFEVWPNEGIRELRISGAGGSVTAPLAGRTSVSVVLLIPKGRSRVDLRVEPAPDSGVFPLELSAPWTERTDEEPAIVAERVAVG